MKSLSKTPAPKKDRIYGSKVNKEGSASSEKSASSIKLSSEIIVALTKKLKEFRETHKTKKVSLSDLKAVYRRGLGAYSSSHRPTITGGVPNTRNAWAMARVNAFLRKAGGGEAKKTYVQDDDLLKMHLGGDMSKHLAPNGKPSNLTHEQWHLVRTPEFKAWFGDWENDPKYSSKVLDENGEPMVLYHGTDYQFFSFEYQNWGRTDNGYWGKGFYFTKYKDVAKSYGKYVLEVFLKIKYPYKFKGNPLDFVNSLNLLSKDDYEEYLERYEDENSISIYEDYATDGIEFVEKSFTEKIQNKLINDGYDGVIGKATTETEYVVFKSSQMKLADGTNTTFDSGNPDIRYADGGELQFEDIDFDEAVRQFKIAYPVGDDRYMTSNERRSQSIKSFYATKRLEKTIGFDIGNLPKLTENQHKIRNMIYDLLRENRYKDGGEISSKRYWNGYQYKGLYIVKFEGESWSYWNIWADEYATKEVAIGFNTKRDAMEYIDKIKKEYKDGGEVDESKLYDKVGNTLKLGDKVRYTKYHYEFKYSLDGVIIDFIEETDKQKKSSQFAPRVPQKSNASIRAKIQIFKKLDNTTNRGLIEVKDYPKFSTIRLSNIQKIDDSGNEVYKSRTIMANGGEVDEHKETYKKWKSLVNMSKSELEKFYNSEEGKKAGLTPSQATASGIDSGRESARWIMRMKDTPVSEWTSDMWRWAKKQISFISRMSGNKGPLYDDKGRKTRKHTSLLIWGHNPEKKNNGGTINKSIKTNDMDNYKFNQLPLVDTLRDKDQIIIKESVFAGNIDKPTHLGERYIHCEVMSKGGVLNDFNFKVINSVGANPLETGKIITRPIANVLTFGRKFFVEPITKSMPTFKQGGLNPDNKEVKQYFSHDSGNAGGVLVGKRHSEGGIKAINKSTGQPLEMEGGEVVITRGAVSNNKKYAFQGKEMTTREILSKLNVDGGGVSFAEGGDVPDKMNCGCDKMDFGGTTMSVQDFVNRSDSEYQTERLRMGIQKERNDHYDTLSKLNAGTITIEQALREIAQKEMKIDSKYPFAE